MNAKKFHSISSSEDDTDRDEPQVIEKKPDEKPLLADTLNEILSKVKGIKYDFNQVAQSNCEQFLFSNDITNDDEIWLMQTPKAVTLQSLKSFKFNFEDDVSQTVLKPRKKERKYNVYALRSKKEKINCVLPDKEARSFNINVHPVAGRIILQEDFQMSCDMDQSTQDSFILDRDHSKISNVNDDTLNQLMDSEELHSTSGSVKKKRRKSTK